MPYLLWICILALFWACGEEETIEEPPAPPQDIIPNEPEPSYGPGHLSAAQRGVPIDSDDLVVISEEGNVSPAQIEEKFGVLVLNRPLYNSEWQSVYRSSGWSPAPGSDIASCSTRDAEERCGEPRLTAEFFIEQMKATKGISFDRVAVNVDLLLPERTGLLHAPFSDGSSQPRFGLYEHRNDILRAFQDLAEMPNIAYITVGLEMNGYYHLELNKQRFIDDYSNYISLYHEVYEAIKERNPNVKVAPGIRWATFMRRTVPEIAEEMGLEKEDMVAVWRAWQRSIEPLLYKGQAREPKADYLAITLMPFESEEPFHGDPSPPTEASKEGIRAYYRRLETICNGLPVVIPQMDWRNSGDKSGLLKTVKENLSHLSVEWISWRRLADLPDVEGASACLSYTRRGYLDDFCRAGMLEESGNPRSVYEEFIKDP